MFDTIKVWYIKWVCIQSVLRADWFVLYIIKLAIININNKISLHLG